MFDECITVYKLTTDNGSQSYTRHIVEGVYCRLSTKQSTDGRGTSLTKELRIITSPQRAKDYNLWHAEVGDIVVRGKGGDIKSVRDLGEYYSVSEVTPYIFGSPIDNVSMVCV